MTTKEFIKILQEVDPDGDAHIRINGGFPIHAERLPGYYDGAYGYIDDEGYFVTSRTGYKVDVIINGSYDFIEDHFNLHDPNNLENIKSKFKFDGVTEDSKKQIIKKIEKYWKEEYDMENEDFINSEKRAIENTNKGWTWFQNKLVDDKSLKFNQHGYYTWKIYNENGELQHSNVYNVQGVYESKKFKRVNNNKKQKYYQWKLI